MLWVSVCSARERALCGRHRGCKAAMAGEHCYGRLVQQEHMEEGCSAAFGGPRSVRVPSKHAHTCAYNLTHTHMYMQFDMHTHTHTPIQAHNVIHAFSRTSSHTHACVCPHRNVLGKCVRTSTATATAPAACSHSKALTWAARQPTGGALTSCSRSRTPPPTQTRRTSGGARGAHTRRRCTQTRCR